MHKIEAFLLKLQNYNRKIVITLLGHLTKAS